MELIEDRLECGRSQYIRGTDFGIGFHLNFAMKDMENDSMLNILASTLIEQFGPERIAEAFNFKTTCDSQVVGQDVWFMYKNKPAYGKITEVDTTYSILASGAKFMEAKEVFETKDDLFVALAANLYNEQE